jgi:glutamate synthase domain-containing protein 2
MCPRGITTHNPTLCSRFDTDEEDGRLSNFLTALIDELEHFARLTGHADIHELSVRDLCTTNREIAEYTRVSHA